MEIKSILPNIFTIFRLVASFVIVLVYITFGKFAFEIILPLYILGGISDYFDGKLARKYNVITTFGKCFDIIADKTLVLVTLLIGMNEGSVHIFFAFIILFREFAVSGMREVLAEDRIKIPASKLGKWKTGFQMTACGFAVGQYACWATGLLMLIPPLSWVAVYVQEITFILLLISSVLTVLSGFNYTKGIFHKKS
jgi:cardiolipin synthase (CMP-forming)